MRVTAVAGLVVVIFSAIAAFVLPYRGSAMDRLLGQPGRNEPFGEDPEGRCGAW